MDQNSFVLEPNPSPAAAALNKLRNQRAALALSGGPNPSIALENLGIAMNKIPKGSGNNFNNIKNSPPGGSVERNNNGMLIKSDDSLKNLKKMSNVTSGGPKHQH